MSQRPQSPDQALDAPPIHGGSEGSVAALRQILGAELLVVARVSDGDTSSPRDLIVTFSDAEHGLVAPRPGTLIPTTPLLQRVLAASGSVVWETRAAADVAAEVYFPGLPEILGVKVQREGQASGVVLAGSRTPFPAVDPEAMETCLRAIAQQLEAARHRDPPHAASAHDESYAEVERLTRELKASEERYRRFIGSTIEAIWCLEPDHEVSHDATANEWVRALRGARFVEANVTFARRFGYASPAEVLGRRAADVDGFWLIDDAGRLADLARRSFSARDLEVTEADPRGGERILATSLFGISDSRGLRSVWAIERDVTDQVEEDRVLRESAEFYRAISQTALDGICVLSRDLEVLDCNDAFLDLVDPRTTSKERTPPESAPLRPVDARLDSLAWFEDMVEAGSWRGEARLVTKSGDLLPVELACRVTDSGQRRYYCFVLDISERLAAAQRENEHNQELAHAARLSTLGEMTSGLAHELNQPLAAIVNYANGGARLLEQPEVNTEMLSHALRSIAEQGSRAATIIRRMRSFARRENEKRGPFELSVLLSEALELSSQTLARANVTVETSFDAADDAVIVDGIQIQQVALNLIRNAVDAFARSPELDNRLIEVSMTSPPTDPDVQARAGSPEASETRPRFVQVTVADNGPGIPETCVGRIFDPFYTSGAPGVGLGLTVSRSIVEAHGGRLWLDPSARGARFSFNIPLRNDPIQS